MKRNELTEPVHDQPISQVEYEAANDNLDETDLQKFDNSEEYYELISQFDPDAADDTFYETSLEFIELRSRLRKELLQNLWIAVGLGLILSSVAFLAL